MLVKTSTGEDVRSDINEIMDEVERITSSKRPHIFSDEEEEKIVSTSWSPKTIAMTSRSGKDEMVRRIIIDAVSRSEAEGPGSGELCLAIALETYSRLAGVDPAVKMKALDELKDRQEKFSSAARRLLKRSSVKTLQSILQSNLRSSVAELVMVAIDIAGFDGKINVSRTPSDTGHVSATFGRQFKLLSFETMLRGLTWEATDVTVIPIDGHVESVAELHHVLTGLSDGRPCVIIARGFAEEVITTLSLNMLRGTLNVIPMIAEMELTSVNSLKDIAVVCETDIVSSHRGDLISAIEIEKFTSAAKRATVFGNTLTLFVDDNPSIRVHEAELRKNLEGLHQELRNIAEQRLRSISSRTVDVKLAYDDIDQLEKVDVVLRSLRSVISYGCITVDDSIKSDFRRMFNIELGDYVQILTPHVTLLAAVKYGISAATTLLSIGAIVERDLT